MTSNPHDHLYKISHWKQCIVGRTQWLLCSVITLKQTVSDQSCKIPEQPMTRFWWWNKIDCWKFIRNHFFLLMTYRYTDPKINLIWPNYQTGCTVSIQIIEKIILKGHCVSWQDHFKGALCNFVFTPFEDKSIFRGNYKLKIGTKKKTSYRVHFAFVNCAKNGLC